MLAHIHDQEIEIGEVPPPARKDKAVLAPLLSRQRRRGSILQEVFILDEGPATLTFPKHLSVASYQDLSDRLAIFRRKAKRCADEIRRHNEMTGETDDE
jgi:hypothetical protein